MKKDTRIFQITLICGPEKLLSYQSNTLNIISRKCKEVDKTNALNILSNIIEKRVRIRKYKNCNAKSFVLMNNPIQSFVLLLKYSLGKKDIGRFR